MMEMLVWGVFYLVSAPVIFSPAIAYVVAVPWVVRYAANFPIVISGSILLAYVFVPFGLWGLAYFSAKNAQDEYQVRIDALPKVSISQDAPDVMLVAKRWAGPSQRSLDALRCQPISKPGSLELERLPSVTGKQEPGRRQPLKMPARYLLLDTDSPNPLGPSFTPATAGEGPFQLSLIENGESKLVAFHYVPSNPEPMFPPILTIYGWFHAPNGITSSQNNQNAIEFAKRAIGRCIDFEAYAVDLPRRSKFSPDRSQSKIKRN